MILLGLGKSNRNTDPSYLICNSLLVRERSGQGRAVRFCSKKYEGPDIGITQ